MATSTTRTFTATPDGPQVSETVRLSQSAASKALAAQTRRLEQGATRNATAQAESGATTFYRGGGLFGPLGADGGSRPRGNVTSGGVPVGGRVPANGGLVGGMPAPFGGDAVAIRALGERVADVAIQRGPQLTTGDPNEAAIAPRYPQDQVYATDTQITWQWQPATDTDPGEWIELSGGGAIIYGIGDPVINQVPVQLGKFYLDQQLGRLYASMPSLTIGSPLAYWVTTGPYTFDATTLAVADAFYSGDIYQGPTDHGITDASGGMFYRLNQSGDWVPQFTCCPEVPTPPGGPCAIGPYEIEVVWDPTGPGPAIGIWYTIVRVPCT